ncbi:MAG TPA: hypothetical protein VFA20_05190 [Myxococcaceae bacterium]|nr:hypothetical protein [Myxococcaceae bacterium]
MASSFHSGTPAFAPTTPILRLTRGKDPGARWVLWPLYAWRVVAPVPRERRLNLFQRAVLAMARAGLSAVDEVAERLLIASDLAALVVVELQNMRLLDSAGRPTQRGLAALADVDEEPPHEVHVGHVLSDAFTGKLWPRFLTGNLPLAEVELGPRGWPVMVVDRPTPGDPSKGWTDDGYCVLPAPGECVIDRPGPRDILRAAKRHGRQQELDPVEDDRGVPHLEAVSFVDDAPRPYLLALRVRRHESGDWMVDDPFGHGESAELRTRLESRLDQDRKLRAWLGPLVQADPESPRLEELREQAKWEVEERLTLGIRRHAAVHERLVAMQRALLEASAPDAPDDKWDDVLVKAQRAVERTLHVSHGPYRGARPPLFSKLAADDKRFNVKQLDAIAAGLGFQTPLPETLSCVRRGKVQHAERAMMGSLRPLLVLALLGADRDEHHPLRRAAAARPDLLHRLDGLASARDGAAHEGPASRSQGVRHHVESALAAAEALLPLSR